MAIICASTATIENHLNYSIKLCVRMVFSKNVILFFHYNNFIILFQLETIVYPVLKVFAQPTVRYLHKRKLHGKISLKILNM